MYKLDRNLLRNQGKRNTPGLNTSEAAEKGELLLHWHSLRSSIPDRGCIALSNLCGSMVQVVKWLGWLARADTVIVCLLPLAKNAMNSPTSMCTIAPLRLCNYNIINPRCACTARVTVVGLCVCLSVHICVCYHIFCHQAQQTSKQVTPTGSALHSIHFLNGGFHKSTAF